MPHILIVEDEKKLAQVLEGYLGQEGYQVHCCHRGDSALEWLTHNSTDLILLDLMLPGLDGLSLCRELRKTKATPVIMTTARVEEIDRLLGLELGADDYICKPYSPREVIARVRAVLRRTQSPPEPVTGRDLVLETDSNRVRLADASVELTAIEMRLLDTLIQRPGRIYSRDQLMDVVYPDQRVVSDRTIDSHIKNLRKKLQQLEPQREFVRSVYGAGYKYDG